MLFPTENMILKDKYLSLDIVRPTHAMLYNLSSVISN